MSLRQDLESKGIDGYSLLQNLVKNIDESLADALRQAGYTDEKYVRYQLVPKYRKAAEEIISDYLKEAQPVHEIEKLLTGGLDLDGNWIRAAVCLAAIDIAVTKRAEQLGISTKIVDLRTGKERHKSTKELLNEIVRKKRKTSTFQTPGS
ncbi:MAG: hypothetical protein ACUVTL_01260 [Thermoproteota archaeon]